MLWGYAWVLPSTLWRKGVDHVVTSESGEGSRAEWGQGEVSGGAGGGGIVTQVSAECTQLAAPFTRSSLMNAGKAQ